MRLVDTHTHLFLEQFADDRAEMMQRSFETGVEQMFLPNIDSGTIDSMLELSKEYPDHCFPMMGLHPCSVNEDFQKELEIVRHHLFETDIQYWAVGETGLDYYWDTSFKNDQQTALRKQIGWAKELNLPIVLHTRDSFADCLDIVTEMQENKLRGVFHCFSGNMADAEGVMALDFYLGIGGVVTFKNSGLAETVKDIPIEYIVLETDSPYLAPLPFRGKRNESAYIKNIALKIAEVKQIPVEEVAATTSRNAAKLFAGNNESQF